MHYLGHVVSAHCTRAHELTSKCNPTSYTHVTICPCVPTMCMYALAHAHKAPRDRSLCIMPMPCPPPPQVSPTIPTYCTCSPHSFLHLFPTCFVMFDVGKIMSFFKLRNILRNNSIASTHLICAIRLTLLIY